MRAISLKPHWAWAVALGLKLEEYRTWRPSVKPGELLAIHASKAPFTDADLDEVRRFCGQRPPDELDVGAIVAVARVREVFRTNSLDEPAEFAIALLNVHSLLEPVDCPGRLRLWEVPLAAAYDVLRQLVR